MAYNQVPIPRKQFALEQIRGLIVNRVLSKGNLYSEKQLAERLHLSRTPIREALAILSREGYVEQLPQKGFQVHDFSKSEIAELLKIRQSIESLIAVELATKRKDKILSEIAKLLDEMAKGINDNDPAYFLERDTEFHCRLAEIAGFYFSSAFLRNIRDKIQIIGYDAIPSIGEMSNVLDEHTQIYNAILKNDPNLADEKVKEHLRATGLRLRIEL